MISKTGFHMFTILLFGFWFGLPTSVEAGCREYMFETSESSFSYTYVCTSSFDNPSYVVVRNFTERDDLQVLEFAPREIGLICERYNGEVELRGGCRSLRSLFSYEVENRIGRFRVSELNTVARLEIEGILNHTDLLFSFPTSVDFIKDESCAVAVTKSGDVNLWVASDLLSMSECLIYLEKGLAEHPRLLLGSGP